MKYSIIFCLVAVVLASGCTSQNVVSSGSGLAIIDFSIDPQSVGSQRSFDIFMTVENFGNSDAVNAVATISGLPQSYDTIVKPLISAKTEKRTGGFEMYRWSAKSPDIYEGTFQKFTIRGGVSYDYHTNAVFNIPVYSESEIIRRQKIGDSLESVQKSVSEAPVGIDVSVSPVTIKSMSGEESIVYNFQFVNYGNGIIVDDQNRQTGNIKGVISIAGVPATIECLGVQGQRIDISQSQLSLRNGKTALMPCKVVIPRENFAQTSQATMSIKIDIAYRYYTEKETQLTVSGMSPLAPQKP